jgi:hypothetical protein
VTAFEFFPYVCRCQAEGLQGHEAVVQKVSHLVADFSTISDGCRNSRFNAFFPDLLADSFFPLCQKTGGVARF